MSEYYQELLRLVNHEEGKNEVECGKYLVHALPRLLNRTPISIVAIDFEGRSYFGSSDFIVSANFKGDTGRSEVIAYIWEIKAPQCFLMKPDDNRNRYCPTTDLYKAENQLIHYVHQARHDGTFRDRFKVGSTGKVLAGGIVIGRDTTITDSNLPENVDKAYASLDIRKHMLHRHEDFKILTWTRILEYMQPLVRASP